MHRERLNGITNITWLLPKITYWMAIYTLVFVCLGRLKKEHFNFSIQAMEDFGKLDRNLLGDHYCISEILIDSLMILELHVHCA